MSVIAGVARAAGAKVLTGRRPTTWVIPKKTKWTLVVMALVLLALFAFAALIPASETPNTEHYSVGSKDSQSGASPLSEPAATQMSEREALDAYGKLPLSFIPNEGQTEEAVRYYAQGAGYGFFFTKEGATLSFAEGKGRGGHALALDFLGANPHATLKARMRLSGEVNYLIGDDPAKWQQGLPPTACCSTGGCGLGSTWPCAARRGALSSTSSTSSPAHRSRTCGLATAEPRGSRLGPGGSSWCGPLWGS
jgi:hypothetical protein